MFVVAVENVVAAVLLLLFEIIAAGKLPGLFCLVGVFDVVVPFRGVVVPVEPERGARGIGGTPVCGFGGDAAVEVEEVLIGEDADGACCC